MTGSVLGDDSRYDAERFVPSWPASYATSREAGPLGALLVNDGAESLRPLRSAADPAVHGAAVLTQLLAGSGGRRWRDPGPDRRRRRPAALIARSRAGRWASCSARC